MKLLKYSLSALTLFGVMSLGQSALACTPGFTNYENCVNMRQQQWNEQQRLGYEEQNAMYGSGYNSGNYDDNRFGYSLKRDVTTDCQRFSDGRKTCSMYSNETGKLEGLMVYSASGEIISQKTYNNGVLVLENIYDEISQEEQSIYYTRNGTVSLIIKKVKGQEYTAQWYSFDDNENLIDILWYKVGKSSEKPWIKQAYQNNQKHGKEYEYDIDNYQSYVVIREANWVNGVKHGEEKFFKPKMLGKPKLVRTVMWQNGKQVSQ